MHQARALLVVERGADHLDHAGADAGLTGGLADGLLARRDNHRAPVVQLLNPSVLASAPAPGAVGEHIDDPFQSFLLLPGELPLVDSERKVAEKAGQSLEKNLRPVEGHGQTLRVAPR